MKPLKSITYISDSDIHGQGLFAKKDIKTGTRINIKFRKKIEGKKQHLGEFINHSDNPNLTAERVTEKEKIIKGVFNTDGDIFKGDELTIDYWDVIY